MRAKHSRNAAVALETALVLPILLLAIFAIIEIGRAMMVQQILTNAAREGARRAVIPGATDEQVEDIVEAYIAGTSVTDETTTISPSLSTANSHEAITVTVSVTNDFGIFWLDNSTMAARVIMRKE